MHFYYWCQDGNHYIVNPNRIMDNLICSLHESLLEEAGVIYPKIEVVDETVIRMNKYRQRKRKDD